MDLIPDNKKNVTSLEILKNETQKWKGESCACSICKT